MLEAIIVIKLYRLNHMVIYIGCISCYSVLCMAKSYVIKKCVGGGAEIVYTEKPYPSYIIFAVIHSYY